MVTTEASEAIDIMALSKTSVNYGLYGLSTMQRSPLRSNLLSDIK